MEKKIASNLETKSLKLADKNSKRSETVNNSIERYNVANFLKTKFVTNSYYSKLDQ